jgi:predicted nuclease of restriction endonuclease-like (RecB) superfamily
VLLYWRLGKEILDRQAREGWGAKVIEQLAKDLHAEFPDMRGLSPRNLKYMRAFAEAWPEPQFVQQAVAQIPWGQNVRILDMVPDRPTREWYIKKTIENGWSRSILEMQIESQAHCRAGAAQTNFERTLPTPQSACEMPPKMGPPSGSFCASPKSEQR